MFWVRKSYSLILKTQQIKRLKQDLPCQSLLYIIQLLFERKNFRLMLVGLLSLLVFVFLFYFRITRLKRNGMCFSSLWIVFKIKHSVKISKPWSYSTSLFLCLKKALKRVWVLFQNVYLGQFSMFYSFNPAWKTLKK